MELTRARAAVRSGRAKSLHAGAFAMRSIATLACLLAVSGLSACGEEAAVKKAAEQAKTAAEEARDAANEAKETAEDAKTSADEAKDEAEATKEAVEGR